MFDTMQDRTTGKAGFGSSPNQSEENIKQQGGIGFNEVRIDSDVVEIPAHDLDKVEDSWGFCLIGYFPARFPRKAVAVQQLCDSWNVSCSFEVHSSGWLIFRFNNEKDRQGVLIAGPFFVFRRPLLLKNMPEFFKFNDHEIRRVPVWIKLPCLPLECWNAACLSMIVSKVGKLLYMDKKTQTKKRISHARALVEVDASKELVRNVTIRLPDGEFDQRIIFEYEPKYCDHCTMLGHNTDSCFRLGWVTGWEYQPKENNSKSPSTAGQTARKEAGGSQSEWVRVEVQNQEFRQSESELHYAAELSCSKELNPKQNPPITRLEQDYQQAKGKMTVLQVPIRQKSRRGDGVKDRDQVAAKQTKDRNHAKAMRKEHPVFEPSNEGPITRAKARKMKEAC